MLVFVILLCITMLLCSILIMKMITRRSFFACMFISMVFFLTKTSCVEAAYLYLNPTSGSFTNSQNIEVKLRINTEGEQPTTSDAVIIFDAAKLKLVEVKEPTAAEKFFPRFFLNNKTSKVFIGSAIQPQGTPQSGDGLIATLVFQGVSSGSTTVNILCEEGKTTDSNITLKKNQRVTDIIDCSKVQNASFTIGGGSGTTPSPTIRLTTTPGPSVSIRPSLSVTVKPTSSPSPTMSQTPTPFLSPTPTILPTPSALPKSGDTETTTLAIAIGLGLALISIIIKIFI